MRLRVQSPASISGLRIWPCRELWYRSQMRFGSGVAMLWCRPAAVALIQPLVWEILYTVGAALKNKQTKKEGWIDRSTRYKSQK